MIATKFAEELLLIATQTPPTHRAAQPYSSSSCSKWFLKRWKTSMWSSISNRRKINCSFCSSPIRAWPFLSWRSISVWAIVKFAVWLHLWRRKTGFIARVPTRPDAGSCPESPDKRPHKCPYRNFHFFCDSSYAVTTFSLVLHLLAWHSCCLPVQWTHRDPLKLPPFSRSIWHATFPLPKQFHFQDKRTDFPQKSVEICWFSKQICLENGSLCRVGIRYTLRKSTQ